MISFGNFLPFNLLSVSIHDILSNLVFIMFIFYFYFLVLPLIHCFDSPNILEANFKALRLSGTKECYVESFYLLTPWVSIISINIVCWFFYVYSYIKFSRVLILAWSWNFLTRLFRLIHLKIITFQFTINFIHVLFKTIIRNSSS